VKKFGVDYAMLDPVHAIEDSECCLVVPAVIAREGIFQYPEGKAFKPAEELRLAAWTAESAWLIPEAHPWTGVLMDRNQIIGRAEKPYFSNNGIKTNLRIFKSKTTPSFLNDVKTGKRKSVSIGFFYEPDATPGEWNGLKYDFVQRNILIDHVAIGVPKARCAPPLCGIGIDCAIKTAVDLLKIGLDPEETEDFIHVPVRDAGDFVDDSFRTIDISKEEGIQAVIGKLKSDPDGSTHVQKYLFDKSKDWTLEKAKGWVEEHKEKAGDQEEGELEKKREAAKERCGKYPISLKEDGHLTKPEEYANVDEDDFADPCNFKYPMVPDDRLMNAWARLGNEENREKGGYSEAEWTWMKNRVEKRMESKGHEVQEKKAGTEAEVERSEHLLSYFK